MALLGLPELLLWLDRIARLAAFWRIDNKQQSGPLLSNGRFVSGVNAFECSAEGIGVLDLFVSVY